MGEYKRLISYIYSYVRGIKTKNVGFAKIESRNGVCKVNISIRIADELIKSGDTIEVYFFYRFGNRIKKILLEKIMMNNGLGTAKLRMSADNIGNHQVGVDDIAGMFLCHSSFWSNNGAGSVIYASEWDDNPIKIEDFLEKDSKNILQEHIEIGYNERNISEDKGEDNSVKSGNMTDNIEESNQNNTESSDEAGIQNNVITEENSTTEVTASELRYDETEDKMKFSQSDCESAAGMDSECNQSVSEMADNELNSILNERRGPKAGDYFRMLCGCYPKIRVNEIDGECIKITPHDISYLPKKYWSLCNNSFLLHGFYNYKYLLLCEKAVDGEKKYMICVPGLFHQKEQKVAGMFGFTEFEGDKSKDVMNFGYWCMYL